MEACCVWPSRLGRKWTHGEGWGDGEATSAWPFYYKPAGRSVLEEAQQLLRRGVLPAECQCSSKYRRTPPAWLTQPLAKVSQCVCGCTCVWWGCCGWCWGPIHSGRPVVGGGDLHAIVESNHQTHSAIEYLLWEQSTRKKLHCFNRASVWCVGGSKVPPLRLTWHVSSTSTLTSTKKSQYIIAEWRKYTLDSADIVQLYSTSGPHRGSGPAKKLDYCYYYNYNIIYNLI